jgi:hypothetical protein
LSKHRIVVPKENYKFWEEPIAYSPLIYDADRIENDASDNSSLPLERFYRSVA